MIWCFATLVPLKFNMVILDENITSSPHEHHRASCSPLRPYASSTPSSRHHRSMTSSSEPAPPRPPPTLSGGLPPPVGALLLGEVGRGSGKVKRSAHGAHLREDPHPHPRLPQRIRHGGCHAAGGMGSPPPGRGPGPLPPLHPEALRQWLQTTHPQAWAIGGPQAHPPPHHHHTGKGKGKGKRSTRDGRGHPSKEARRGRR